MLDIVVLLICRVLILVLLFDEPAVLDERVTFGARLVVEDIVMFGARVVLDGDAVNVVVVVLPLHGAGTFVANDPMIFPCGA